MRVSYWNISLTIDKILFERMFKNTSYSFSMSYCPHLQPLYNRSRNAQWIFIKFVISEFYWTLSTRYSFPQNRTLLTDIANGYYWRTLLTDMTDGHCWRTWLTYIVDGHCWRTLLTDMTDGHCWRTWLTYIDDGHCWQALLTGMTDGHWWRKLYTFYFLFIIQPTNAQIILNTVSIWIRGSYMFRHSICHLHGAHSVALLNYIYIYNTTRHTVRYKFSMYRASTAATPTHRVYIYGHQTNLHFITLYNFNVFNVFKNIILITAVIIYVM